jgi:outer membrane protein assembly factor BamB/tRNA A-37 threonylcarbamoyl transferase component Bud32
MLLKKIGTSQLGKNGAPVPAIKREDETASLETLRNSLGANNVLARTTILQERYEVEQVIGYGGMSTVYRGRDMRFTKVVRTVAIKEMFDISTDPLARQEKFKMFEREASMLATLSHASIPKIFDFFAQFDRNYVVMEYIEGRNLESLLEERGAPMDERDVLEWAIQLCDVLSYLHNQKPHSIVFRDMKPSNVMLSEAGKLRLVDFGIAKVFLEDKKGTMIGTEGYSPPEQYKGVALPVGDIYALGATMHQLLTNSDPRLEVPFTFHERMPRALNPAITPQTEAIIMKALEFEANKRWANIEEFKLAILNVLKPETSSMTAALSDPNISIKGISTRDLGIGSTSLSPDILTERGIPSKNPTMSSGARSNQTQVDEERSNRRKVEQSNMTAAMRNRMMASSKLKEEEEQASLDEVPETSLVWRFACEEEVRSSPIVNRGVVYVGSYDSNLYALEAKTGEFLWKAPTNAGVCSTPCVFESLVAVGSEDGNLYAYDLAKGKLQWTIHTGGPVRSSPRYQTGLLYFGSDDQHLYCVEGRTGRQAWKQRTWKPIRSSPAIANGTVYFGSNDGHLYALDATNGQQKWKYRTMQDIVSSPLVADNMIYVGSMDGHVYCLDAQSSWAAWRFKTEHYVTSSPALANGKLYVGSVDGNVYCLDAKSGRKIWKYTTGGQVTSSPRIDNGVVYIGSIDGNIYALDAEKGRPVWVYPTAGPIPSSPAIADGIVYIGSLDYSLYALAAR